MSNNEIREKRKKVICDLVKDDFYVPMKEKELAAQSGKLPCESEEDK